MEEKMKLKAILLTVFALCIGVIFIANIFAAENKEPSKDEMMATWMKYAQPGENHKLLEPFIGKWDAVIKWWQDPNAPVDTSKGTSECKWIMGGRYIMEDVDGFSMGMPFKGMSLMGYDNYQQKFLSLWIDEMGTGFLLGSGTADPTGKIITQTGTYDDVMTGQKDKPYKTITRIIGPNKHIYEMYVTGPDGKEFKNLEVVYTRKK
jgi:hypothetical protein